MWPLEPIFTANPFLLLFLEVLADSQRHSAQKLIVP
jgi:hypothetical protein